MASRNGRLTLLPQNCAFGLAVGMLDVQRTPPTLNTDSNQNIFPDPFE